MAAQIVVVLSFVAMLVMLGAVIESVERRERFAFGIGVLLILVGLGLVSLFGVPEIVSTLIVLGGFVAMAVAVAPLLQE